MAQSFAGAHASGSFDTDLPLVKALRISLLEIVADDGPGRLSAEARHLLEDDGACERALVEYWHAPQDDEFFAKALLQPYLHWLTAKGMRPHTRNLTRADNRCPFCGGAPQLSILDPASVSSLENGSGRQLQCAGCLSFWPFRRVVCPSCGEEDDKKLAYFHSPDLDHLRVDACDTCRRYVKTVDLGRLGLAVPLVDEVAGAALDAWAVEHGYQKIELNLLGL